MTATISALAEADFLTLRREFVAMPGLCLTTLQAARLLSIREPEAHALLDELLYEGLLVRDEEGQYRLRVR
jgi:DNA-binding IclR family transcriptional regulator